MRPKRTWTEAELDVLDSVPPVRAKPVKLTRDQILDIRRRADLLTERWSVDALAREYGVSNVYMSEIVNRKRFKAHAYEPTRWWRRKG